MIPSFLLSWVVKKYRIKKGVYTKNYKNGGLKMVNIKDFIMSLKLMWIKKLVLQNDDLHSFLNIDVKKLILCGKEYIQKKDQVYKKQILERCFRGLDIFF